MPFYGRVSAIAGTAQYHSPAGQWSGALVNEPVAAGTGLRTAQDSEAELHAPGARVALAPSSELQILRFDGDALQIAAFAGRIGVHLDGVGARSVEIDLPHGGVWLDAPGDYDIVAGDARVPAAVQVFAGKARLGGELDDRYIAAAVPDWFSDWWRSQGDNADLTDPHPWPNIAGMAALGAAGRWEIDPELGNVWYPSDVAADWTPYRDGAWRFLAPWGWTWIDNTPWGFAPSHFGRWARIGGNWGWVPGERLAADYSPAAVAFLGTAGIGLSRPGDAGPAVAWFPLAPGEMLGAGGDADGAYRNRRFATAVPRAAFAGGLPAAASVIGDVPERRFADAPVILDALGIPPAGAAAIAAAPKRPDTPVSTALQAAPTEQHQPFVVALRDAPVRAVVREIRKRLRVAAALRPRASTSAFHAANNRRHLAAARGGA